MSFSLAAGLSLAPMASVIAHAQAPVNRFAWGQCTWWAANVRPDVGAIEQGNASAWINWAQRAQLKTGNAPQPGAIAVFQPGVQGAAWTGHVAHVLAVDPDGQHFTVDEMNFPIAGQVTQRLAVPGPGVDFIY